MRRLIPAVGLLCVLSAGCGAEGITGAWVVDVDATAEEMIRQRVQHLPPEARSRALAMSESIKERVPADLRRALEAIRLRIEDDGTWSGTGPQGRAHGSWPQEGQTVTLNATVGAPMRGTWNSTYLVITTPGLPAAAVLVRD